MFKLYLQLNMREYFKYTLLATAVSIAAKLGIFYADSMHQTILGKMYLIAAPVVLVLFIYPALVATRDKEFDGYISGKLASAAGVRMAVFVGAFNGFFDYAYYALINKQILITRLQEAVANNKANPEFNTPELLANANRGAENFFTPFMQTTFPMFITIAAGFFFTIVFSYVVRRYKAA